MIRLKNNLTRLAAVIVAAATMGSITAQAGTFTLDTTFNGTSPSSTPPWLIATFAQNGANDVTLTLTSSLEIPSEFMTEIGFNVNPTFTPSALTISQDPGNPQNTAILHTTDNAQNLTGGGSAGFGFDVLIDFTSSNAGGGVGRFNGSDVVTFDIMAPGLLASDFDFINTGSAAAHVGAHVQGIPGVTGTLSGAIKDGNVPDGGTTLSLLGLGLGGLAWVRRFSRR